MDKMEDDYFKTQELQDESDYEGDDGSTDEDGLAFSSMPQSDSECHTKVDGKNMKSYLSASICFTLIS